MNNSDLDKLIFYFNFHRSMGKIINHEILFFHKKDNFNYSCMVRCYFQTLTNCFLLICSKISLVFRLYDAIMWELLQKCPTVTIQKSAQLNKIHNQR